MAIRQVRTIGDDILRKECKPVKEITPRIAELIEDMFETMYEANGVGLAAPQVGVLKQIVVMDVDDGNQYVLINPEIIEQSGSQTGQEGCLSVPGKTGVVTRPDYAKVKAYDEDMNEIVKYDTNHPLYVIVNARGKDNRVLGILKEVKSVEAYGKCVTAQVVGVVNMNAYNARIDEENRQKEIAKQKASIEKELKSEIEKMNNIALYEKMAKEHPENPRLAELVNALKELGE